MMKVVILAGGLGSRLSEETSLRPKPMVEVGGHPVLWHIMKGYAAHERETLDSVTRARAAALQALQLDPQLAEAHTSLALLAENYDWDFPKAEEEYRKAIAANPNYPTAHQWYSEFLMEMGRNEEAISEARRARTVSE